ncbi:MAG: tetraacyldisaccharide 4'-kinase [Candidatus Marinimicrobia bacterium]|nr:tetraacyldisaccharide 4'-kinase [Candidatus Neomarinimicrobiota bacterium]|tara:strand:+ start:9758 stop:10699 length:942 start_codon:yes stop_codon:yes gene_type:complete
MKILKPKFWDKNNIGIFAIILLPITIIYQAILGLKKVISKEKKFSIPVVCIGNIYIGGTGKTPLSVKIYEILKELKMNPVIVKKEYKSQKDEVLLIKKYCSLIESDRRDLGILKAVNDKYDVVILDDGFQDYSIKKNINIICFNQKQKVGNGLTIPSGPLRENLKSLENCDLVICNGEKDLNFETKLKKYKSNLKFFYYKFISKNLSQYKNKKLIAFSGIGNPNNFFDFLKENRLNLVKEISYPDHYDYSKKDLEYLIELKRRFAAKLITTEKDYMRINSDYQQNFDFIPIQIDFESSEYLINTLRKKIYENN